MVKDSAAMAITYDYYRIFYHVAQCQSFTQAAEVLGNNQPNITRCMNNLEQALGCKLFFRSNRGITLTPEGERLYLHVSIACDQLRMGEEEIQRDRSLESGILSIGASETALHLLLLDRLSAFHTRYPGVRLRITNDSTPQAIAALVRGQTDCAVVTTPNQAAMPLRETRLLPFHDVLLCGSQYRELASRPRRLKDLEPYPFICMGRGTGTYEFYQQLFARHNLPLRVDMEAATMDQVLPMIRHNLGIGFYSEELAGPSVSDGTVYQIRLVEPIPERAVCLIEDTARPQSIAMKALRCLLCEGAPV